MGSRKKSESFTLLPPSNQDSILVIIPMIHIPEPCVGSKGGMSTRGYRDWGAGLWVYHAGSRASCLGFMDRKCMSRMKASIEDIKLPIDHFPSGIESVFTYLVLPKK